MLPLPNPPLQANDVLLRLWCEADLPAAHQAASDPSVPRFSNLPYAVTVEELRHHMENHQQRREANENVTLAIADSKRNTFLGSICLMRFDWDDRRCEVGFWLAPDARGKGVATTAVSLLSAWALTELQLGRVDFCCEPENTASQSVAKRCGFVREGILRSFAVTKKGRSDVVMFSLLPSDLKESPSLNSI